MSDAFVVQVEGNLVVSITKRTLSNHAFAPGTPLSVGTQLATNFRERGRMDDEYLFADGESARTFATLCLQFMTNLIEQRTRAIAALPGDFNAYSVDPVPPARGQR